jgi:hypothetical protein
MATKKEKVFEKRGSTSLLNAWKYSYRFAFKMQISCGGNYLCLEALFTSMVSYIQVQVGNTTVWVNIERSRVQLQNSTVIEVKR